MIVAYVATLVWYYSLPIVAAVVALAARATTPERRGDAATRLVLLAFLLVYLPGAAVVAYARYDPFCFG